MRLIRKTLNMRIAGCIAIPEGNMIQLMQNLRGDCIIVIDSASNINNY